MGTHGQCGQDTPEVASHIRHDMTPLSTVHQQSVQEDHHRSAPASVFVL